MARVRDIAAGLTYTFRLFELEGDDDAAQAAALKDQSPSLGGAYVAATIPTGSLADAVDSGVEVGLSSLVHHTGAAIDYTWDTASGLSLIHI